MAKIKLTKNELKNQKDGLKRYTRYLPTLVLKKQQLQLVIRQVEAALKKKKEERDRFRDEIYSWVDVFGEKVGFDELVKIKSLEIEDSNIAGVDIQIFKGIQFELPEYDLFEKPLWIDAAVEKVSKLLAYDEEMKILEKQIELLGAELRVTTQRVNLFEKVKIPEAKENIRMIQIYLGDQQTAAVVCGKIAKNKLVKVS
ncbi:MAG: V-type ATP synthase subunit D [Spirochaetia bacterium]|jgi:V/A-type H+-transporting ATPase subunit D|nr:V-type ATP synthase subunit D [Spirochaetia bacterium]